MAQFYEKISTQNAKYLLSLNDDQLRQSIAGGREGKYEWNGETIFKDIEVYMKQLRTWLKKAIKEMEIKGKMRCKYKFSKTLVDCGRKYSKDFGVQRLTRELRGFLIKDEVVDLDMKNAHPSILYNIIKTHYPEQKNNYPFIRDYVKQRERYLNEYGFNKKAVLVTMNSNKNIKGDNQRFIKLDKEFKSIQKLIWNTIEDKIKIPTTIISHKNTLIQNKEGRFINVILTYFENKILDKVMCKFGNVVNTLMYDGFTIDKDAFNDKTIDELNKITEDDGIFWSMKEHDDTIKINEEIKIDYKSALTYDEQKIQFEKNHFIIENPLMFGRMYKVDGEDKYQFYGKEKFRDLVKPIKFFDIENTKTDAEFFTTWIEDENRKSYKEVRFLPKIDDNSEIFNSFKGFNYQHTIKEFSEDDEEMNYVLEKFGTHINLLCNEDENAATYLFKYIAHLIQKPWEKPGTAIILKSKQGFGKDTLIDIIEKMIGRQHVLRTAEMDDIFGTYNVGLRDRLFLQLNEVEGKDGFSNKEKIKNIITEENTIIREKYISQYDQKNYLRLFILSNNLNPIEINHDDRRFCVFKSHHKKPNKEYFNDLHAMKDNEEQMNMLFNYIMNYDISDFSPRNDRPKTDAYNNMKEHNQNPLYKFVWEMFINDEYKEVFGDNDCKKKKKDGTILCKSNSLFQEYREYLRRAELDFIKINFKLVKSVLGDIGIIKKKCKVNSETADYYVIEPEVLKEQLQGYGLDEEIEELDDDDFE